MYIMLRILDFCPLMLKEFFPITFTLLRIVIIIIIIIIIIITYVLLLHRIMQGIDF